MNNNLEPSCNDCARADDDGLDGCGAQNCRGDGYPNANYQRFLSKSNLLCKCGHIKSHHDRHDHDAHQKSVGGFICMSKGCSCQDFSPVYNKSIKEITPEKLLEEMGRDPEELAKLLSNALNGESRWAGRVDHWKEQYGKAEATAADLRGELSRLRDAAVVGKTLQGICREHGYTDDDGCIGKWLDRRFLSTPTENRITKLERRVAALVDIIPNDEWNRLDPDVRAVLEGK
jgi:hypothetical protein